MCFSDPEQIPLFSCEELLSLWPCMTHFTEVQTSWIRCLSSRKSLAKKPDELDIYLWQIRVVLYPSSCMYLCL